MSALSRLSAFMGGLTQKSVEGSYRGPAIGVSNWGNPFPVPFGDGYQDGLTLGAHFSANNVPIAYACVMQSARALALCPAVHEKLEDGRWVTVTTSPASRVLRYPNSYETWPQFILNVAAAIGFEGEAFAQISRDERYAINALRLLPKGSCSPYVDQSTGDVYYSVGANPMMPAGIQYLVPARDMIHFRLYTPRHPLIGESPIKAASMALGVNVALSGNQAAFFSRMNRPSGVLSTDTILKRDQIRELRAAFDDQSKSMNAGGIPILAGGLKFQQMAISSQDSQLIEAQRMSIEDVARAFGMPLALVASGDAATGSTEALINFWLATGLGALVENLECSLERAFDMGINERVDFKVDSLLRIDFKTRMDGLSKGVQGGIYTIDEAREREQLPKVDGGDQVFLQRQMTPVSLINDLAVTELTAPAPAVPEPEPEDEPEETEDEDEETDVEVVQALTHALIRRKRYA